MGCERWHRPGPLPGCLGWSRRHHRWSLRGYNTTRTCCPFGNLYIQIICQIALFVIGAAGTNFFSFIQKWKMKLNGPAKVSEGAFHGKKMLLFPRAIQWHSRVPSTSWLPTSSSNSSFQTKQWVSQKGRGLQGEHSRNYASVLTLFPRFLSVYVFPL